MTGNDHEQNDSKNVAMKAGTSASPAKGKKSRNEVVHTRIEDLSNDATSYVYHLGDKGREEHMMLDMGFEESLVAIAQLKEMDRAFVLRSGGEWRYSIVVAISKARRDEDPFIKFLVDDQGHTKSIPLRQWTKLIRIPVMTEEEDHMSSRADLMLSTMALNGPQEPRIMNRKCKSEREVNKPLKFTYMEDNRRKSESCLTSKRLANRRRQKVLPTNGEEPSINNTSRRPSDWGLRRDSGATTTTTSSTVPNSLTPRHRKVLPTTGEEPAINNTSRRPSDWGLRRDSGATTTTTTSTITTSSRSRQHYDMDVRGSCTTQFDVKFNKSAFLAALSSINETSGPI